MRAVLPPSRGVQSKKLSYMSDSQNAFRGILDRAKAYTYLGVPSRDSEDDDFQPQRLGADFTRRLIWISTSEKRINGSPGPIEGFPIWSWMSCCCSVNYDVGNKVFDQLITSSALFSAPDEDGTVVRLVDKNLQPGRDFVIADNSSILHIFSYIVPVIIKLEWSDVFNIRRAVFDHAVFESGKSSWSL
jgi:hypothetical protein